MTMGSGASAQPPADDRFDESRTIEFKGEITSVDWSRTPIVIHLTDEAGKAWAVEGRSPNWLMRMGITQSSVSPGTMLTVRARPARNGTCVPECLAKGLDVMFPSGIRLPNG